MRRVLRWSIATVVLCAAFGVVSGCSGLRASTIPLGGQHDPMEEEEPAPGALARAPASTADPRHVAEGEGEDDQGEDDDAEVVEVVEAAAPSGEASSGSGSSTPAKPGASFQPRPYARGQSWTRLFDADFAIQLGGAGNMDMHLVSHQEARFEVLAASSGRIEKLAIEYKVDRTTTVIMGRDQSEPEALAGNRYVVTFGGQGRPQVRNAAGATPSKKELDNIYDDAREPLAAMTALRELSTLAAKGQGDFSLAGAVALAGGEDDDSKISAAKASLVRVLGGQSGGKTAQLDLAYTLTGTADPDLAIELELSGSMVVADAPARYLSIALRGPVTLRAPGEADPVGRGTSDIKMSYTY